jgi:hypothetical protein
MSTLRQGSSQVGFEKLDLPPLTLEEGHEDAMARSIVVRHDQSIGE